MPDDNTFCLHILSQTSTNNPFLEVRRSPPASRDARAAPEFRHTSHQCRLIMKRLRDALLLSVKVRLSVASLPKSTSHSSPPPEPRFYFSTGAPLSLDDPLTCGSGHVPAFPILPAREYWEEEGEGEEGSACLFHHQTRSPAGNLLFISRR